MGDSRTRDMLRLWCMYLRRKIATQENVFLHCNSKMTQDVISITFLFRSKNSISHSQANLLWLRPTTNTTMTVTTLYQRSHDPVSWSSRRVTSSRPTQPSLMTVPPPRSTTSSGCINRPSPLVTCRCSQGPFSTQIRVDSWKPPPRQPSKVKSAGDQHLINWCREHWSQRVRL